MRVPLDQYPTFLTQPWWAMGDTLTHGSGIREVAINETATRARAGILNIVSGVTIVLLWAAPQLDPVRYVAPFVIFDMVVAAILGLTPVSPAGVLGTTLTLRLQPVWKPTQPKRFAWSLGASLGVLCLIFWALGWTTWIFAVIGTCFVLTWLEAVLGFCVGCWMYSKLFGCKTCRVR